MDWRLIGIVVGELLGIKVFGLPNRDLLAKGIE